MEMSMFFLEHLYSLCILIYFCWNLVICDYKTTWQEVLYSLTMYPYYSCEGYLFSLCDRHPHWQWVVPHDDWGKRSEWCSWSGPDIPGQDGLCAGWLCPGALPWPGTGHQTNLCPSLGNSWLQVCSLWGIIVHSTMQLWKITDLIFIHKILIYCGIILFVEDQCLWILWVTLPTNVCPYNKLLNHPTF